MPFVSIFSYRCKFQRFWQSLIIYILDDINVDALVGILVDFSVNLSANFRSTPWLVSKVDV